MTERVCAYIRDSGGQAQELSASQQIDKIVEFCQANDLILTRQFVDSRSGGSVAGRAQFLEMIDYMTGDAPESAVVVWSYSRFSRDYDDLQFYLARLRANGKRMISVTDPVPETLDGRILEAITGWKNAKFREDLSRDIRRGHQHIVAAYHAWPGGGVPLGYKRVPIDGLRHRDGSRRQLHRLEPDENAGRVADAFRLRANGASYSQVLEVLRPDIRTSRSVGELLRNTLYIGRFQYGGADLHGFCEPIVDLATWQAAQKVNAARAEQAGANHPRRQSSRYLLSGLVRCGVCNTAMVATSSVRAKYSYSYYHCNSHVQGLRCSNGAVRKERLEEIVLEALRERVLTEQVAADIQAALAVQAENNPVEARLKSARRDLAAVRSEVARLVAAIKAIGHSEAIINELAAAEKDEKELVKKVAELEAIPTVRTNAAATIANIRQALETGNEIKRGKILRTFVLQVIVAAGKWRGEVKGKLIYQLPGTDGLEPMAVDL